MLSQHPIQCHSCLKLAALLTRFLLLAGGSRPDGDSRTKTDW